MKNDLAVTCAALDVGDASLHLYIQRWERLNEEKKALSEDQKQVMLEAKAAGYDTKIIREMIKLRSMSDADRIEREQLVATYRRALGMPSQLDMFEKAA